MTTTSTTISTATMREREQDISFVIHKRLGVLSHSATGWRKELNLVEWNGRAAKLDIREWDPEHAHMSRGVTLRRDEAERLQFLLYRFLTGTGKRNGAEKSGTRSADAGPSGAGAAAGIFDAGAAGTFGAPGASDDTDTAAAGTFSTAAGEAGTFAGEAGVDPEDAAGIFDNDAAGDGLQVVDAETGEIL